jgi:hypothetical protein
MMLYEVTLLISGLVVIYTIWRTGKVHRGGQDGCHGRLPRHGLYYGAALTVLLVVALLLITLGYGVLASPGGLLLALLVPAGLALGVAAEFVPRYERAGLLLAVSGLLATALALLAGPPSWSKIVPALFQLGAGFFVVGLPLWSAARRGRWLAAGGVLLVLGGILLAVMRSAEPAGRDPFTQMMLAFLPLFTVLVFTRGLIGCNGRSVRILWIEGIKSGDL